MAKGHKYIVIDNYTSELLQEIVRQGKANDPSDAVGKSAAVYLGIRYKSREERKLERELAHVQKLGKRATGEG